MRTRTLRGHTAHAAAERLSHTAAFAVLRCAASFAAALLFGVVASASEGERSLDLVSFGQVTSWADPQASQATDVTSLADLPAGARCMGVVWHEERDVREIRARFADGREVGDVTIQYWFRTWPSPPPRMPTFEDPLDDPWQGRWVTAHVERAFKDGVCTWTFKPLETSENKGAKNLPGVVYRRTLKMRLVLPADAPKLESLSMASESVLRPLAVRIEFGCGQTSPSVWDGHLEIFNGVLVSARPWNFGGMDRFEPPFGWKGVDTGKPKGIVAELMASVPAPAGSNDITVVTVRAASTTSAGATGRTFSFSTLDLDRGPIYVPDLCVLVTKADDPRHFAADYPPRGKKIRDQIPREPEQTFERATREIPPQDPWVREGGGRVYLPVAADSSWQKFAVEYGGDIFIDRRQTKAKGAELKRLTWEGNVLRFRIGTQRIGMTQEPYYRDDQRAKVSIAEDCLPIVINRWEHDGLSYEEEAFATLLSGPLDPNDPNRSEQTSAVLMLELRVRNPGSEAARAACVLDIEPREALRLAGRRVYGQPDARRLRAVVSAPPQGKVELTQDNRIATQFDVPAGKTETLGLSIPFVSDLNDADAEALESLDYAHQRQRVAQYWRDMIAKTVGYTTPEPEFNALTRAAVPHLHLGVTKDPKSGLYMVPAASYGYQVFENESCFQVLMLDALGDTERATQYLKTLTELQGSRSFPGDFSGPYDGVFHGVRVDDDYDYTHHRYGLDQGTVLWTLARHYSYTRDAAWLKETLPHMVKAVQWIERQRAATKKTNLQGERLLPYGLLPACHLEDNDDWGYWFAVNAYCVAGMVEMASAMRDIGHPEAESYRERAAAYREDFRTTVVRSTELAPVTRMRDGTYAPYVPTRAYQRFRYFGPLRVQYFSRYGRPDVLPIYRLSATREVLYGPMILLNLRLFDVQEPIADWILNDWEDNLTLSSSGGFNVHGFTDDKYWFSQGGMVFQANLQNPILVYLYRNEIPAAIRGVYNGLVSCLYPEVHALTEEYHQWRHGSGPFFKSPDEARLVNRIRDMLVLESGEDLMLAPGIPRRWLASKEGVHVERIQTTFGPVGYRLAASDDGKGVTANIHPPRRNRPKHLWLYVRMPDGGRIASVEIDGKPWPEFDAAKDRIELPQPDKSLEVTVRR